MSVDRRLIKIDINSMFICQEFQSESNLRRRMIIHFGSGIINNLINKLPFEIHIPGYSYCGPGTKLKECLARGDQGINPLDSACKDHDIAHSQNRENIKARNIPDKLLAEKA